MNASEIETTCGLAPFSVIMTGERQATLANGDPLPLECPLWALRCIIRRRSLDAAIDVGIAALGANQQTAAWAQWNFGADTIQRSDILVNQIRGWIGYNQRQMDTLFAAAIAVAAAR